RREIDAQPAMSDRGAGVVNLSGPPRTAVAYNFGPNGPGLNLSDGGSMRREAIDWLPIRGQGSR
ncbi:hypothetical protein KI387_041810, partial [Taxus chinensis]